MIFGDSVNGPEGSLPSVLSVMHVLEVPLVSEYGSRTACRTGQRTGGCILPSGVVRFFGDCVDGPEGSFPAILHVVHVLEVPLVAVTAVERLAAQLTGQVEVALAFPAVPNQTGLVYERLAAVRAAVAKKTRGGCTVDVTWRKEFWKENHI